MLINYFLNQGLIRSSKWKPFIKKPLISPFKKFTPAIICGSTVGSAHRGSIPRFNKFNPWNSWMKKSEVRKQIRNVIQNAFFKISDDRKGFENDASCNTAVRIYIVKTQALMDLIAFDENDDLTDEAFDLITKDIRQSFKGVYKYLLENKEESVAPLRLQLFFADDEDFYSVVYGFKLQWPKHVVISELRYLIGLHMSCEGRFLHTNNWDSHKSVGAWDISHLSDGPIKEFKKGEILNFFDELAGMRSDKPVTALKKKQRSSKSSSVPDPLPRSEEIVKSNSPLPAPPSTPPLQTGNVAPPPAPSSTPPLQTGNVDNSNHPLTEKPAETSSTEPPHNDHVHPDNGGGDNSAHKGLGVVPEALLQAGNSSPQSSGSPPANESVSDKKVGNSKGAETAKSKAGRNNRSRKGGGS
jgi:hypothetical protein